MASQCFQLLKLTFLREMLHRKNEMVIPFLAHAIFSKERKKAIDLHLILLQLS